MVWEHEGQFADGRDDFAAALASEGGARMVVDISRPEYPQPEFQNQNFFGGRWLIMDLGLTTMDYRVVQSPTAEAILTDAVKLTINEAMTDGYIDKVVKAVRIVAGRSRHFLQLGRTTVCAAPGDRLVNRK